MLERRYVVIDERRGGGENIYVLEAGATEADGIKALDYWWGYLTKSEKREARMELVLFAYDPEYEQEFPAGQKGAIVNPEMDSYAEAVEKGWDTRGAYNPIAVRESEEA